jgi:hypothetical protein
MRAVFYRYSRLDYEEFIHCIVPDPFIEALHKHLQRHDELLNSCEPELIELGENYYPTLHAWLKQPSIKSLPGIRAVRRAKQNVTQENKSLLELYRWAEEFISWIRNSLQETELPYDSMRFFLQQLAQSGFPTLLLWDKPDVATRLFKTKAGNQVVVKKSVLNKKHSLVQACHTCLAYSFAALNRWMPRGAWIGAGFAKIDHTPSTAVLPTSTREVIHIEPDLNWIDYHWSDLSPLPLAAGTLPWEYLDQRIECEPDTKIQSRYRSIVQQLQTLIQTLHNKESNYAAVEEFIRLSETLLKTTVNTDLWEQDPHHWTITVVSDGELEFPVDSIKTLVESRQETVVNFKQLVTDNETTSATNACLDSRRPLPLTLLAQHPQLCRLQADELIDWFFAIGENKPTELSQAKTSLEWDTQMAQVFSVNHCDSRFMYTEPNPARIADRLACYCDYLPAYVRLYEQRQIRGIKPPTDLIDNRVVRRQTDEVSVEKINPGEAVEFRSTLFTEKTRNFLLLEYSAPVYRHAPDIFPLLATSSGIPLSYGTLYAPENIWYLTENEAQTLAKELKHGKAIAAFYQMELARSMHSPSWLDCIVNGKRSAIYTESLVVWHYVLHMLRTCEGPVLFTNPHTVTSTGLPKHLHNSQWFCL